MAEISDSIKQIKASVIQLAESSGNRTAFVDRWNALIDQSIASINATQVTADKYAALDKRAFDIVTAEKTAAESYLGSISESYRILAVELGKHGGSAGGHDILSVLGTYSSMQSGPYCSTIVLDNYHSKMNFNLGVMKREKLTRARDLETLGMLKVT